MSFASCLFSKLSPYFFLHLSRLLLKSQHFWTLLNPRLHSNSFGASYIILDLTSPILSEPLLLGWKYSINPTKYVPPSNSCSWPFLLIISNSLYFLLLKGIRREKEPTPTGLLGLVLLGRPICAEASKAQPARP